jgi:uncharacterized protein (TIGR00269 family)
MNVLKGDLLRLVRVGPMPQIAGHPKFVIRIKPLIEIQENESVLYGKINKIPSHPKECPNSVDNPLRGKTRKFLNDLEGSSPGIKYSLYESALKIVPFVRTKFKTGKIGNCKKCGEPTSQNICKVCKLLSSI